MTAVQDMQTQAAAVLADGRVKMVIGFRIRANRRMPAFATDASAAASLVFDDQCKQNPAALLCKPEVKKSFPVAVVARPAVMRSLVLLASESQFTDKDVLVLAMGNGEFHGLLDIAGTAALLKEKYANLSPSPELLAKVKELAAMTPDQRARWWMEQFDKCTRCYACRAACPGCYCTRCIVEKNIPQWISTAAAGHGNYAWNLIRAYHQAGRCTLCGACEAACPQGLPLMLLNATVDREVADLFDYKAGYDPAAKPLIGTWDKDDDDEFVR